MATLGPHRQHSSMSPATWHPRQLKQKAPQIPAGQGDMGLVESCKERGKGGKPDGDAAMGAVVLHLR